jgi:hypothetical protein
MAYRFHPTLICYEGFMEQISKYSVASESNLPCLGLPKNKIEAILEASKSSIFSAMSILDPVFVECNLAPKGSGLSTVKSEWKASWLNRQHTDLTLKTNCRKTNNDIEGEFFFVVRFNWVTGELQILFGAKILGHADSSFCFDHDGTPLNEQLDRAIESILENEDDDNNYILLMNAYPGQHDDLIAGVELLSTALNLSE